MKKYLLPLIVLFFCVSCSSSSDNEPEQEQTLGVTIMGTLTVNAGTPAEFTDEVTLTAELRNEMTMDAVMHQIRFSDKMPVRVDLTFEQLPYTIDFENYRGLCQIDTIIPLYMGVPYTDCPFVKVDGYYDALTQQVEFSFTMAHQQYGDMPATYVGTLVK